ncbi:MAG TPA: hypothetical protein VNO70_13355, partial [Blastocatellia bacterium]|nr:hypothetical protein [Blastocatellia bacterium]
PPPQIAGELWDDRRRAWFARGRNRTHKPLLSPGQQVVWTTNMPIVTGSMQALSCRGDSPDRLAARYFN